MSKAAALAYSGGLDTTCAIAWLKEDYGFDEVIAVLVDVGQEFDLEDALERGKAAGADQVLLADRKDDYANEQVAKAIMTNALYENRYPLVSALSRPVVAHAVAEVALEAGAEAVVHGCTGKGNDQLRFELAFKANYPGVRVIAPLRDRDLDARRGDRVRARPRHPGQADPCLALLDRREPVRPLDRGGDPRGRVDRAAGGRLRADAVAAPGAGAERGRRLVRARRPGRARRRRALARGARRGAEREGRRLRDRPDRHDREPRRRHQEPRDLRGAGRRSR